MRVKRLCALSLVVLIGCCTALQQARGQAPETSGVTNVFSIGAQGIAAYDSVNKKLRFFSVSIKGSEEIAAVSVPGQVMGVVALREDYVVATSMGRGDLTPPIRVHTLAKNDLRKKEAALKVVYQRITERPQITQLRVCNGSVWLGFFESKYNTLIGRLEPLSEKSSQTWNFSPVVDLRMGDSFDCLGEDIVVGRSYGDIQGQDGDLLLMRGASRTLLPSYRGVRGIESIGDVTEPTVIIGDGWHSNYGKIAQGRISVLRKRQGETRFTLELLDRDSANYNFTKFRKITLGGKPAIIALGSSQIILLSNLKNTLRKRVLYTQKGSSHVLDFDVVDSVGDAVTIAVADEGLHIVQVNPEE